MLYYVAFLLLAAAIIHNSEGGKIAKWQGKIIGVGMNNHLYMRQSTSRHHRWIPLPHGCCVTQIHVLSNGHILGVGTNRHLYIKRNLYGGWAHVPNSCCVKDVTTFRSESCERRSIVGVGMGGKLYSKSTLNSRWVGPYAHSGVVKAVAGVTGRIYGVGMDNFIYRREDLNGRWSRIPGSCCVKDISVQDDFFKHFTYGIGMNNQMYSTSLANTRRVRWTYQGRHTCCIKSVQTMPVAVKIVGIGTNKQLYSKSAINAPWSHVPGSSNLIGIAPLINKQIVGIRTNHRMYTKPSIGGSSPWREVPHSCCVKSAVQLSSGRVIGVGLGNQLWHRAGINGRWIHIPHSGAVTRITKTGNDAIIGIGMDRKLYIRSRYYSRWSGPLRNSGQVIDISMGSDGYLYGIGTDYRVYMKTSRSLSSTWRPLPVHNCCVIGLAVN
ncbi:uncharacterized protein LOC135686851 [Rhopilema esculentum]|uniref:uncharacterized protein LOC135686851 n=1 Tax=Rhopilema esculentum TaxID=499914 RepID=UPI0031D30E88